MPIDLNKIPPRLTSAVKTFNMVPLIGAGVSRHAITTDSEAFPSWRELIHRLAHAARELGDIQPEEEAQIEQLVDHGRYLMAAEALKSQLPSDVLDDLIRKWFRPSDAKPGPIHRQLVKLRCPLILTTNYDTLLEDAYAKEFEKNALTVTFKQATEVRQFLQSQRPWIEGPLIFKIHGSATSPSDAVLGEMDYRNLLYREPGYRIVLSAIFVTKIVLMLGFSFADPELTLLTESLRESLKHRSSPDYIVLPKDEKGSVERRRLREDYGLEVIEYQPSENHAELLELVEHLASFVPPA